ncbi:gluconokinase [Oscillospiraceae bacterium MB08-C2-2]|nr:gluconokinase [Oscillospiraceae bacterium MB08-C2-2]
MTYMGIDIGTSSVRAAIYGEDGSFVSMSQREYTMISTEVGMAALAPDEVFEAMLDCIADCVKEAGQAPAAVSFSAAMHSFLVLDDEYKPLTDAFTWGDTRADEQARALGARPDVDALCSATGCKVSHPLYPCAKILYIKEQQPEIFAKGKLFATMKQYFIIRLFGQNLVDYSDAGASGLFNIHSFTWDKTIVEDILGIGLEKLGTLKKCTTELGVMRQDYRERCGLPFTTKFYIGSTDGQLAHYGCGALDETAASSTVGTSGALRAIVNNPPPDAGQNLWCYAFRPGLLLSGGAINNAGLALKWLRDEYQQQFEADAAARNISLYQLFDQEAAKIAPGSEGLLFMPLLTSERSPDWMIGASGSMYGLRLGHGRFHIVRAAMEGVMYRMYSVFEVLLRENPAITKIIANGGYAKSPFWLQMQADIFNREIHVSQVGEASVYGAALLAMCAMKGQDFPYSLKAAPLTQVYKPNPEAAAVYAKAYQRYKVVYERIYKDGIAL